MNVCKNESGQIGFVTHRLYRPDRWYGVGLRGGRWYSRKPVVIAETIDEYIKQRIEEDRKEQ